MSIKKTAEELAAIRLQLLAAERVDGLWETAVPAQQLPAGMIHGEDAHLAYLTLVYTISGGREPASLWAAAGQLAESRPGLFDPTYLAHSKPTAILPELRSADVIRQKSEATVWQRIGQALVMRGKGSVTAVLAAHDYDAEKLLAMLQASKTTFPILSGEQTAPRWLWGLAGDGRQPIRGAARLRVPASPAAKRALAALEVEADHVSAEIFDFLDSLGRKGCVQHQPDEPRCPVSALCPVANFCQFGG